MPTVAELLIESLAAHGVRQVWGVVGDALNPVTDAIRREERLEWIGVRHEEAAAFAASAQSQLTGDLAVCMGTVGPGSIHLLNGLYDAKKSHTPVLAICGQVPREEMGTDFFQEVDNDVLFSDVSVFCETVTSPEQLPALVEQRRQRRPGRARRRGADAPRGRRRARRARRHRGPALPGGQPTSGPDPERVRAAASAINAGGSVTMLVGMGARHAREEVLRLAERLSAPMVLTLKAKDGFDDDNPYEVGQSGLIGNPAAALALESCDVLVLVGTDFPYTEFLPEGKVVVQLDVRGAHVGRRTTVRPRDRRRRPAGAARAAAAAERQGPTAATSTTPARPTRLWGAGQAHFADPDYDHKRVGLLRRKVDNPDALIRPELLAAAVERHAADDAIFTTDTGMSTVWLSRFVRMSGRRRLLGSYNLGSMANAMPMALGAAGPRPRASGVAFCGDGGLSMLLGDLLTAVSADLPVKLVVFDNGRLGMVKLEMEQVGLAEFGTVLHNPDFARVAEAMGLRGIRVTDPHDVDAAVAEALAHPGPVLLDVVTNPDEVAVPPKPTLEQGWGFAIAKMKELVVSPE